MIHIITGKINAFKTTTMIEHYEKDQQGDGFVSLKFMHEDKVDHYEIMKLSTKEKKILMIHQDSPLYLKPEEDHIGPYHLQKDAINWVKEEIKALIKQKKSPIYLDEIGQLELNHQGFHEVLVEMIQSSLDLIIVIRSYLLDDVIKAYQMKDVMIEEVTH